MSTLLVVRTNRTGRRTVHRPWRDYHGHDGRRPCGLPTDGPAHLCDGHRDEMRAWTPDRQAVPA